MMRSAVKITLLLLAFIGIVLPLNGQTVIDRITTFSAGNFSARDCGDNNIISYGSSLCVTDLEGGGCSNCGGGSTTGDNSSSYSINGIDVADYCTVSVLVVVSGDADGNGFEGRGQCGEDRVRLRISSGGDSDTDTSYPQGPSYFDDLEALLPISGTTLNIDIQIGTQEKSERLCIEEIVIFGDGQGIAASATDNEVIACTGEDVRLRLRNTRAGETYQWYRGSTPLTGETNDELRINSVETSDEDIYVVEIRNSSGCESIVEYELFVEEGGTGRVSLNDLIDCEGERGVLRVRTDNPDDGGFFYEWTTESGTTILSGFGEDQLDLGQLDPTDVGGYCVFVEDRNADCVPEDPACAIVDIIEGPGRIRTSDVVACTGERVRLRANPENDGNYEYTWLDAGGTIVLSGLNEDELDLGRPETPIDAIYFVAVANPGTPCVSEADITVVVQEGPGRIQGSDEYIACRGQSLTLDARPENDGTYEFEWIFPRNSPAPFMNTNGTVTIPNIMEADAGGYLLNVIDEASGCITEFEVVVIVTDAPDPPSVSASAAPCGEFPTLRANAANNVEVFWYDAPDSPDDQFIGVGRIFDPGIAGTYYAATAELPPPDGCISERIPIVLNTGGTLNTSISANQSICVGDPAVTLTASGGTSYTWDNGQSGPSIRVSPSTTTTYTVTIIGDGDCDATESVTVTVNPEPTITVAIPADCSGNSFEEYEVTISTDPGNVIGTNPTVTIIPTGNSDFALLGIPVGTDIQVTATNDFACSTTITIPSAECGCPELSPPTVGNTIEICDGEPIPPLSANFSGDGTGLDIRWYNEATGGTLIATGRSISATQTGTYYAEVFDTNRPECTSTRMPIQLVINPKPDLQINGSDNVCKDAMTAITVVDNTGTGNSFIWNNSDTNSSITVGDGTYSVTVRNDAGCEATAMKTIGTFPETQVVITGDTEVCGDERTTLMASGSAMYQWSNSATSTSISVGGGTYTVMATDQNGCESMASEIVTASDLPSLIGTPTTDCSQDRETYTIQVNTEANDNIRIDGDLGTLSGGGGFFTVRDIMVGQNVTVVVENAAGCTSEELVPTPDCSCPNIAAPVAGNDVEVCAGDAIRPLIVTANTDADTEVRWYRDATSTDVIATGESISATQPGTYYAEVFNTQNTCTSPRTPVQLTIFPNPSANIIGASQICPDASAGIDLNASISSGNASSFQWSNNANGANTAMVTISNAGTYMVTVTDANGCSAEATKEISEYDVTQATISGDLDICPGDDTQLIASAGDSYNWSNFAQSDRVTVNAAGTYTVTVTDNNDCESIANATVSVNDVPSILSTPTTDCSQDRQTYIAQVNTEANNTLTVNGNIGTVSGGGGFFTIRDIPAEQNIVVTVRNDAGCVITQTITAPDCSCPNLAAPLAGGAIEVCEGEQISALTVSANTDATTEVRWYADANSNTILATGLSFAATTAGTYYAELFDTQSSCTSQRTPVQLVIFDNPTANIVGASQICPSNGELNLNANLSSGNASSFQWSNNANGANTAMVTISNAGTYMVTVTDANGCSAEAMKEISEFAVSQATISGDLDICPGDDTQLIASAGDSYNWSNFAQSDRVTVNAAGTYRVTVTDNNDCESIANATVSINDVPSILSTPTTDCSQDRQTYIAQVNTEANNTLTVNGNIGTVSGGGGFFTIRDIPADQNIVVTVRNQAGCTMTQTITAPDCSCPNLAAPLTGAAIEVCEGQQIPALMVNANTDATTEVRWYADANSGTVLATGLSFAASASGTYYAELFDTQSSCTSQRTPVQLVIFDNPTANIVGASQICPSNGMLDLNANLSSGNASSFQWSNNANGANTAMVTISNAGTYTVIVTDANGCSAEATKEISEYDVTQATISGDLDICPDESTQLIASAGDSYNWSNFVQSDRVTVNAAGTYTVTVTDNNDCESIANATVSVNDVPSILSTPTTDCSQDRQTYIAQVNTESNNTLTVNGNIGTVSGGGGFFTIRDIPAEQNIVVTVRNQAGCTMTQTITAPDCSCPNLAAPLASGAIEVCEGEQISALTVSANTNATTEVRWYADANSNTILATGLSFSATTAGTYYAELFDTQSSCTSQRTPVQLVIFDNPTANIVGASQICPSNGELNLNANLSSGNASSFQWSNNANGANTAMVTISNAGTYMVTVTDANGCSAEAMKEISEFAVSQATISGDLDICPGDDTQLIASAGDSYNWSNFAQSDRVTINTAGTYSVTVTDNNGCESIASASVTESDVPSLSITSEPECSEDRKSYFLSLTTEADVILAISDGALSGGGGFFNINVPENTPLTIVATNTAGCETIRNIAAPDCSCEPISAPQSTGDVEICAGETIRALSVSDGGDNTEVRWYTTPTGGTAIATGLSFTPTQAGTYYAEIFSLLDACKSPRTEVRFIINEAPTANISGPARVCPTDLVELTANASSGSADMFQWSSNAGNAVSPSVMVGAGIYTVTITDANGCISTATQTVTEIDVTPASIDGDLTVCEGEQTTLTASVGASYNWSNFAQSNQVRVGIGDYSVTITDNNGCESFASVEVTQDNPPTITLVDGLLECSEDRTTYSFRINTQADVTLESSLGIVGGANGFFNISGVEAGIPVAVTARNAAGCEITQTFDAPDCTCAPIAAPQSFGDETICEGDAIPELRVSGAGVSSDSEVRWYNTPTGGNVLATGANFTPPAAGTYFAEIINTLSNCQSPRTELRLIVNAVPMATISGPAQACPASEVTLSASISEGSVSSYQWSSNAGNAMSPSVEVGVGIYTVTITDANGCIATATRTIEELEVMDASIDGDLSVCPDEQTILTASAGASYNWSNFAQSNQVSVGIGDYSVTVTDANGCESVASVEVSEDALPTITLVDGLVECSDDRETYSFQITTEVANEISVSLGDISGSDGNYIISNVTKDIPVTVTVNNPTTGCSNTQAIQAPDCSCPQIAAPQNASDTDIEICTGDAFPLLSVSNAGVSSASEIRWYNTATGGNLIATGFNFTPDMAGTYFAEIFNTTNECTSPRTAFNFSINEPPVANIVGATQVCPEDMVTLDAGSASSYEWSNGANTQTIEVRAGTYGLTITDANGCVANTETTIEQFAVMPASISGTFLVCPDETTVLTASEGASYEWSNFAQSNQVGVGIGTYSVTVTNTDGCESVAMATVSEEAVPSLTLSSDLECSGDRMTYSLGITTEAGNNLTASLGDVSETNGVFSITNIPTDIPVTIRITNAAGCESEQSFNAPDCNCPQIAAPINDGDAVICAGEEIPSLSVSSPDIDETTQVRWYNADIDGIFLAEGTSFTPTEAGTYFAEINTADGCQSTRTAVTLSISDAPLASITGDTEICADEQTTLTVTEAATYAWSTGDDTQSITVGQGDYTVVITDADGCQNTASISVTTSSASEASISGATSVCEDATTTLTASAGNAFLWSTGETSSSIEASAGDYSVTVTDANGCGSIASVTVQEEITPFPIVAQAICSEDALSYTVALETDDANTVAVNNGVLIDLSGGVWTITEIDLDVNLIITLTNPAGCSADAPVIAPDCDCPSVAAPMANNDNLTICEGATLPSLSVSIEDSEAFRVDWYDAATDGTLLAEGTLEFTPSQAGTYFVEAVDIATGCVSARIALNISEQAAPGITFSEAQSVCVGETLVLTASTSDPNAQFTWDTNETTAAIEVGAGTYTVNVIDSNGCENTASVEIIETAGPTASITGVDVICENTTTELTASGGTILWSTGETDATINVGAGDYSVTVTDANGCEDTASISVSESTAPSINVSTQAACSDDGDTYSISISTEAGNTLIASAGDVSEDNGNFTITNIAADMPITITVTNTVGCESMQSFAAPMCDCPQLSTPSISENAEICTGEIFPILTATSTDISDTREIRWYDVDIDGMAIATGTDFMPSTAGTYFAELFDTDSGCTSARVSVTFTINELPEVSITSDNLQICEGESTTLVASGGTSFVWSNGETSSSIEVSEAGIYEVTVMSAAGCAASTSEEVLVNASPELLDLAVDCAEDLETYQISFTTSADANVTFTAGEVLSATDGAYLITDIPIEASIIISILDENTDCFITQEVSPPNCDCPFINAPEGENVSICEGEEGMALSVTTEETFQVNWLDAAGNVVAENSTSFLATEAGIYFAQAIDVANNCVSELAELEYSISALPEISILNQAACSDDGDTYSISITTAAGNTLVASAGDVSEDNGIFTIINIPITSPIDIIVTNAAGCESMQSFQAPNCDCPQLAIPSMSEGVAICVDEELPIFNATSPDATDTREIRWYDVEIDGTAIATGMSFTPTQAGTYFAEVFDTESGCTSLRASVTLSIDDPVATITSNDLQLCEGESTILNATGGIGFVWSTGAVGSSLEVSVAGTYGVTVTTEALCNASAEAEVTVSEPPVILTLTTDCSEDRTSYQVNFGTSTDAIIESTGGEVMSLTGDTHTITDIAITESILITMTDANTGCSTGLEVLPPSCDCPNIAAPQGENVSICEDDELPALSVTVEDDLQVNWYDVAGNLVAENTTTFLPDMTGTYFAQAVDITSNCTSEQVALEYSISTLPEINVVNQAACSDDGDTYSITIATELGNMLTASVGDVNEDNGVFTISNIPGMMPVVINVVNTNGCESAQSFDAPDCECPTIATPEGESVIICEGEEASPLSVTVEETFQVNWYDAAGNLLMENTTTFQPTGVGTYLAQAVDINTNCTSAFLELEYRMFALPEVAIEGAAQICDGVATTLTASGALSYEWSTQATDESITVSEVGTYSVIGTDANGCSGMAEVSVAVAENPVISIDAPAAICEGTTVSVTASGGDSYEWSTGETTNSINIGAGTYTVLGRNAAGCETETSFTIEESEASETLIEETTCDPSQVGAERMTLINAAGCDSVVVINTVLLDAALCNLQASFGTVTELDCAGDNSGSISIDVENGAAPYTYNWSTVDNRTGSGTSDSSPILIEGLSGGEYEIIVLDANGQQVELALELFEPAAIVTELAPSDFDGFGVACAGDTNGRIVAEVSGGTGAYTYVWSTNSSDATLINVSAGEYTLTITDANGCTDIVSETITEPLAIGLVVDETAAACEEAADGSIVITTIQNADLPVEYSLNGVTYLPIPTFPFEIDNLAFGDYTLFIQDMRDCVTEQAVNVSAAETAFAEVTVNQNNIQAGEEIELTLITNLVPDKITWTTSTGDSLSCQNCLTPTATPSIGTTYFVEVVDENGCSATGRVLVFVEGKEVLFANAFSPNDDGNNDIFYIQGGDDLLQVNYFHIFDRWGDLVFSIDEPFAPNDIRYGWDGYVSNQLSNSAVFAYVVEVEFENGTTQIFSGEVNLVR